MRHSPLSFPPFSPDTLSLTFSRYPHLETLITSRNPKSPLIFPDLTLQLPKSSDHTHGRFQDSTDFMNFVLFIKLQST